MPMITRTFKTLAEFNAYLATTGASFDNSMLPRVTNIASVDNVGYRVCFEEEFAKANDKHAFVRPGLAGSQRAGGYFTLLGTTPLMIALGQTSATVETAEVLYPVLGTLYTGEFINLRRIVPGTVTVSAPSVPDLIEPLVPDGTLTNTAGDTGTINYVTGLAELNYSVSGTPGAGNVTVDYSYDPAPGSTIIPSAAILSTLILERLEGVTGSVDFTWNLYSDAGGTIEIANGTSGGLIVGARYAGNLYEVLTQLDEMLPSGIGRRWLKLTASTGGTDNTVMVQLVFKAALSG